MRNGISPDYVRIVELKESMLEDNDRDAAALKAQLKKDRICLINLMSGPGSGKTSLLLALAPYFRDRLSWAVMEADIDSDVDARTLLGAGIPAVQLHTGGMCHLDADMTRQGIKALCGETGIKPDMIVLENIGNLVCPAEYDTGAALNMTILSVPEGDDKPVKYPLMYEKCDVLVVSKIDTLPAFAFDRTRVEKYAKMRNPDIAIFYVSAKTNEGMEALARYLLQKAGDRGGQPEEGYGDGKSKGNRD